MRIFDEEDHNIIHAELNDPNGGKHKFGKTSTFTLDNQSFEDVITNIGLVFEIFLDIKKDKQGRSPSDSGYSQEENVRTYNSCNRIANFSTSYLSGHGLLDIIEFVEIFYGKDIFLQRLYGEDLYNLLTLESTKSDGALLNSISGRSSIYSLEGVKLPKNYISIQFSISLPCLVRTNVLNNEFTGLKVANKKDSKDIKIVLKTKDPKYFWIGDGQVQSLAAGADPVGTPNNIALEKTFSMKAKCDQVKFKDKSKLDVNKFLNENSTVPYSLTQEYILTNEDQNSSNKISIALDTMNFCVSHIILQFVYELEPLLQSPQDISGYTGGNVNHTGGVIMSKLGEEDKFYYFHDLLDTASDMGMYNRDANWVNTHYIEEGVTLTERKYVIPFAVKPYSDNCEDLRGITLKIDLHNRTKIKNFVSKILITAVGKTNLQHTKSGYTMIKYKE